MPRYHLGEQSPETWPRCASLHVAAVVGGNSLSQLFLHQEIREESLNSSWCSLRKMQLVIILTHILLSIFLSFLPSLKNWLVRSFRSSFVEKHSSLSAQVVLF